MENEPDIYRRIHKFMLPGDYIAMMLTGEIKTTLSGLSEGILWDFKDGKIADTVMNYFGIERELIPDVVPTFSIQGETTSKAAKELGIKAGIKVTYRAGDQPNNALSLNVLNPGEIAATAGTSGVVYGISSKPVYDRLSRVNTFLHVNHMSGNPRYGVLCCINGSGILNRWVKHNLFGAFKKGIEYAQLNEVASRAPAGSDGLMILPYGNGAERTLENRNIDASIHGLDFNRHKKEHFLRAVQEGIVFALNYGVEIMRGMGIEVKSVRAGHANLFLSPLFARIFASMTGATVELFETDGAQGSARGAGIGAGYYENMRDAFQGLKTVGVIEPDGVESGIYAKAYQKWRALLEANI
jgi:xylulokinase